MLLWPLCRNKEVPSAIPILYKAFAAHVIPGHGHFPGKQLLWEQWVWLWKPLPLIPSRKSRSVFSSLFLPSPCAPSSSCTVGCCANSNSSLPWDSTGCQGKNPGFLPLSQCYIPLELPSAATRMSVYQDTSMSQETRAAFSSWKRWMFHPCHNPCSLLRH